MTSSASQMKEKVSIFSFLPTPLLHPFFSISLQYQNRQIQNKKKFGHLDYKEDRFAALGVMTRSGNFQKEEAAVIL